MISLPLEGVRVIDLTRARSGPTAARQFADWGADVIMVESPGGGDDIAGHRDGADFQNLHRNKRSVTLDLKQPEGRNAFLDLIRSADILLENFRPNVKRNLKIDFGVLHEINPRLIYGSISGFGEEGPYSGRPGLDPIIQAMGGLMSITGKVGDGPMRAGIAVSDLAAGLYCAIGVLIALYERERTGKGRWVRTSLLESEIAMLDFQAARWLMDGQIPVQEGNHHPTAVPIGLFDTADGHVIVAASNQLMFSRFAKLVGREDWLSDPRFADRAARYQNREAIRAELGSVLRSRPTAEWVEACNEAGVPCGDVKTIDQVFSDPQVQALQMSRKVVSPTLGEIELVSQPIHISGVEFDIRTAAPAPGMHMDEIFRALGYDDARIEKLKGNNA